MEAQEDKKIYEELMNIKNNNKLVYAEKIDKAYDLLSLKEYKFLFAYDIVNKIFK